MQLYSYFQQSLLQRLALATLILCIAVAFRFLLLPLNAGVAFLTFYPAVFVGFYLCGSRIGGILALCSAMAADYFFIPPNYSFKFFSTTEILSISIFLLSSALIGWGISQKKKLDHQLIGLIQYSQAGIITIDLISGRITSANPAASRVLGYKESELLRIDILDLTFDSDKSSTLARNRKLFSGEVDTLEFTTKYKTKNGSSVICEVRLSLERDASGKPLRLVDNFIDVTKRELLKQKLNQAQQMAHIGSWWLHSDTEFFGMSQETAMIFNLDDTGFTSFADWFARVHPDDQPAFESAWRCSLKGAPYDMTYRIIVKGNIKWIHALAKIELNPDGNLINAVGTVQDITELKLVQLSLQESESRFRTTANSAPVMIWIAGTDKFCTWFNQIWLNFTGRTQEQEMGNGWAEGVHPEDFDRCLEIYISHFDRREEFKMDYRLKRHDGEYRWIHDNGVPRFDSERHFLGYIGSCIDITDSITSLKIARASEENYQAMFSGSPDAYLMIELKDGTIADCNLAAERMLKGHREEIIGKTPDQLSPPTQPDGRTSLESVPEKIQRTLEIGYNHFEWVHRRFDGEDFWAEVTVSMIKYHERPVFMVAWRDISERKRLEYTLQEQQVALKSAYEDLYLLNHMVESSADPFYVLDVHDGFRMVMTNHAACRHFGLPKEKLLTMRVPDWDPDVGPEKLHEVLEAVKENRHLIIETRHYDGSGGIIPVEVSVNYLKDDSNREYVYGYITDIRSRRELENALRLSKESAEDLAKSKAEFLANMSHEIRTPMNSIMGLSQLALNKPVSEDVRDYLEKINTSSESLLGILNDILDLSKMEASKFQLENHCFNLDNILDNLRNLFSNRIEEKGLSFNIEVAADVPMNLMGSALRLQQILSNLLGNAIKFTERGRVAIKIKLLESEEAQARLHFCVSDTGIGISQNDQTKLFHPFSQVDTSATRRFGGTGLGLVISRNLLNLMGSDLHVQSTLGQGSTFTFELLLTVASHELYHEVNRRHEVRMAGVLTQNLRDRGKALSGKRILVTEDDRINQQVVKEFLTLSGVHADIAKNGMEALALLEQNTYDAVLMDIHMPEMGGVAATENIRLNAHFKDLPVIALTACVSQEERESSLASGMNDFISKPINPETLIDILTKWLGHTLEPIFHLTPDNVSQSNLSDTVNWPIVEGIDSERAACLLSRDKDLFDEILQIFMEDNQVLITQINNYFSQNQLIEAAHVIHKLKSQASYIGALELTEACTVLEMDALSERTQEIDYKRSSFEMENKRLLASISAYLMAPNISNDKR